MEEIGLEEDMGWRRFDWRRMTWDEGDETEVGGGHGMEKMGLE